MLRLNKRQLFSYELFASARSPEPGANGREKPQAGSRKIPDSAFYILHSAFFIQHFTRPFLARFFPLRYLLKGRNSIFEKKIGRPDAFFPPHVQGIPKGLVP
jgi:hypothetical protein